jgi:acetolactate synthase-1/2/3 large subunit
MFFEKIYSQTRMFNPDYSKIAEGYGIGYRLVEKREDLRAAIGEMLSDDKPFLMEVRVLEELLVMPMIPPGKSINEIMLNGKEWFEYGK